MRTLCVSFVTVALAATGAFAQEVVGRPRQSLGEGLLSTTLFGVVGIVLAVLGFKIFDIVIHANIEKEIFENKNIAAALLAGAVILGVSLIVAATLLS
jgi:uncharacterized membrane protein YjfL (UPF0719 family)